MAGWMKTMDAEQVLCRVKVSSLDRAYRKTRQLRDEIATRFPEARKLAESAFETVHQLYTDAHENSPGVPLSHRQFTEMGCSQLPSWAKRSS
jgi:hypothetical protein